MGEMLILLDTVPVKRSYCLKVYSFTSVSVISDGNKEMIDGTWG